MQTSTQENFQMTAAQKYMLGFGLSMGLYMIVLIVAMTALNRLQIDNEWLKALIAVSPMLPIGLALSNYIYFIRQMDELEKKIQFEACAFSLAATGIVTFTAALLEQAGFPALNLIWVFPMQIFFWGIGGYLARRRF